MINLSRICSTFSRRPVNYMTTIKLNANEVNYIKNAVFIKEKLKYDLLSNSNQFEDYCEINITNNQIVNLEELFSEQLQKVGFDEDYNSTEEGKLLEDIIDKISDLE